MIFSFFNKISYKLILKILISIGILAVLVLNMNQQDLRNSLSQVISSEYYMGWIYGLTFLIAQLFFISWRWKALINIGHFRMSYIESLQVNIASQVANMLFLATISGIAVKIALACQFGASLFKSIFATAIDRGFTLIALIILTILFLPALGKYMDHPFSDYIIGIIVAAVFIGLIVLPFFLNKIMQIVIKKFSKHSKIRSGLRYVTLLLSQPFLLLKVTMISLIAQICFFVAIYGLTHAMGLKLSLLEIMVVMPIIVLISSLPISFGGWGVREGAFIYGMSLFHVPAETAFTISVQIGLLGLASIIICSIPALLNIKKISFIAYKKKDDCV